MVLVDALHVNHGGGKVLLDFLIEKIVEDSLDVFFLLDKRCEDQYPKIQKDKKKFLPATLTQRFRFYKKNKNAFSQIFCFANLPPLMRLNVPVYTYFHQPLFLKTPKEENFKGKVRLSVKTKILDSIKNNTDYWIVQSNLIKQELSKRYSIDLEKIVLAPFYPSLNATERKSEDLSSFLYVSEGYPHKNHKRLIESFCDFYDKTSKGHLTLTVSKMSNVFDFIEGKRAKGYPIYNKGFVPRKNLSPLYASHSYLVFPSMEESFGLGIVEAIEAGCKVIGADLPYMHQACIPSHVFDPNDRQEITGAFLKASNGELKETQLRIHNEINNLIDIIFKVSGTKTKLRR